MKDNLLKTAQFACNLGEKDFKRAEQVDYLLIDLKEAKEPELLEARRKIEQALDKIYNDD